MLKFCYFAVFWRYEGSAAAASEKSVILAGSVQFISKIATGSTLFHLGSVHLWVPMGTSLVWMRLLCVDYPLPEWHVKRKTRIVCLPTIFSITRRQSKKVSSFRLPLSVFSQYQCSSMSILWFGKVHNLSDYGTPVIIFPSSEAQHVFKSY